MVDSCRDPRAPSAGSTLNFVALSLAASPCPNDTFVFHALVHGLIPGAPEVDLTFADVDVTNTAAERGEFDLVKVSYAALPWLLDDYDLLPTGGALGRGCGPLVLARDSGQELAGATVAVPGDRTTAYLLMRLWMGSAQPASIEVVPFHEIMPGIAEGRFDAGLVIHEARFTYPDYGLSALVDLGAWWEEVQRQHIALYVNEFTRDLGEDGYAAAGALLHRAHAAGLVPSDPPLR